MSLLRAYKRSFPPRCCTTTTTTRVFGAVPAPAPAPAPAATAISVRATAGSRAISMATAAAAAARFAGGEDSSKISRETDELISNGWALCDEGMGLEKTYYFTNYTKTLDLVHAVGVASKSKNHHSTMVVKYGSLYIQWTTHSPRGLSSKDTDLARYTDGQAKMIGVVDKQHSKNCSTAGPTGT